MTDNVLRSSDCWWVEHNGKADTVDTPARTPAELFADRKAIDAAAAQQVDLVNVSDLDLLSPVTTPARVVAQMVNYRAQRAGVDKRGGVLIVARPDSELYRWLIRGRTYAAIVRPDGTAVNGSVPMEATRVR